MSPPAARRSMRSRRPRSWCATAALATMADVPAQDPFVAEIAVTAGVLAIAFAFLAFPSLAALGGLGCAAKILFLSGDVAAAAIAAAFCRYSRLLQPPPFRRPDRAAETPDRDRLERAARRPLHRGVRAGGPRLVLGDHRARRALLRLRAARRRPQDPGRRADRQALRRPDRPGRAARRRILGAHLGLPPVDAAALHRHQRARQHRRRNLVVAFGDAELRRIWPFPRLPRHRQRPHPAAPLRGGDQPPRQI